MRLLPMFSAVALIGCAGAAHGQPRDARSPADERVIIFFAWDRPVIDGDAAARLDGVAADFQRAPGQQLELGGHADRSGPAGSNVRSGRLRAEAVAAYLAARGVPRSAMRIVSHGEARPLIPTQDGVREPQNRRVEVFRTPGGGPGPRTSGGDGPSRGAVRFQRDPNRSAP